MTNLLIQIAAGAGGAGIAQLFPFLIIGVLFYVMLIRPQQKQRREQQRMLSELKTGDKIMTVGGIMGMITNVKEHSVIVKIADNVKVEISRAHVGRVMEKEQENQ